MFGTEDGSAPPRTSCNVCGPGAGENNTLTTTAAAAFAASP